MIIKSIELKNIRSYKEVTIDFKEGINFLSGDIGSGKSTILLAIEFALFGFKKGDLEANHLLRKGELESEVKLIFENETLGNIEIYRKLKKSKNSYTIVQENGYIKLNENLIDLSPQELNSKIFEIFNFPKSFISKDKNLIYRFTIYTPQEQLKEVLYAESEKRLEIIRKLFSIDKYKQLKDAIHIYSNKLRDDKKTIQIKLEPKKDFKEKLTLLEKNHEELNKKELLYNEKKEKVFLNLDKLKSGLKKRDDVYEILNHNKIKLEKALSTIKELELNNNKLSKEKKNFEKIKNEFDEKDYNNKKSELNINFKKLKVNLKELESNKKVLEEEKLKILENIQEKEKLDLKLENLNRKKLELKNKLKNIDLLLIECKVKDLEHIISKLILKQKKQKKLEKEQDTLSQKIIKLDLELNSINVKKKEIENKLNQSLDFDSCPTCFQEISCDHKEKLNLKLSKELMELTELKTKLILKNKKINSNILELKNKLELLKNNETILIENQSKLKLLFEEEKFQKNELLETKKLEKEILILNEDDLNKDLNNLLEKISKRNSLDKELEKLNENILLINKNSSNIELEIMNLNQKFANFKDSKENILKLERELEKNFLKIKLKEDYLKKLKKINENLEKVKLDKIILNEKLDSLREKEKLILNYLVEIATNKNNILTQKKEINKNLENILLQEKEFKKLIYIENLLTKKLIEISSIVEQKVFTKYYVEFNEEFENIFRDLIEDNDIEVRLQDDFSIIVEQNGYDIDIKNLSGGEKSSLALSYRLALKKIIENNISEDSNLSLLILDEPTDGFSNEQIDRLGLILKKSNLKQIILVSHDEKIESIANNIIHIEKENHVSSLV